MDRIRKIHNSPILKDYLEMSQETNYPKPIICVQKDHIFLTADSIEELEAKINLEKVMAKNAGNKTVIVYSAVVVKFEIT